MNNVGWEQLVVAVLILMALLVQFMRRLKGTLEEEVGDETEATNIPVAMKRPVPIRESRGPSDAPRVKRPAMESFHAVRRRQPRVAATARDMRRGIVLMAVLGPCRGVERSAPPGE